MKNPGSLSLIWEFSVIYTGLYSASKRLVSKKLDSILSGLKGVGGILDDLIVTGPNDKEHLRSLKPKCVFLCLK